MEMNNKLEVSWFKMYKITMVRFIWYLPNLDGYKKVHSCAAGSHLPYDSQATNRKQGGPPVRAQPYPPHSYWSPRSHTYMTPSWPEYTKTPPRTGGSSYI